LSYIFIHGWVEHHCKVFIMSYIINLLSLTDFIPKTNVYVLVGVNKVVR